MREPDPLLTPCVRLVAREDSRGGDGLVRLCLQGPWLRRGAARPEGALKQNTDVFVPTSQFPPFLGKVISGPICKLWSLPLVTDPSLLLSFPLGSARSSSDRSLSWAKYPRVAYGFGSPFSYLTLLERAPGSESLGCCLLETWRTNARFQRCSRSLCFQKIIRLTHLSCCL